MEIDRKLVKTLAGTADIVNTINGGTVFPTFNTTKELDHYRMEVSVPSITPDSIKVEISESDLLIYQNIRLNAVTLPNLLGLVKIARDVLIESISAEYEDEMLVVIMPFGEVSGGHNREINILKR